MSTVPYMEHVNNNNNNYIVNRDHATAMISIRVLAGNRTSFIGFLEEILMKGPTIHTEMEN